MCQTSRALGRAVNSDNDKTTPSMILAAWGYGWLPYFDRLSCQIWYERSRKYKIMPLGTIPLTGVLKI